MHARKKERKPASWQGRAFVVQSAQLSQGGAFRGRESGVPFGCLWLPVGQAERGGAVARIPVCRHKRKGGGRLGRGPCGHLFPKLAHMAWTANENASEETPS